MTLTWPKVLSTAIDLAAPYGLLAWAWVRCARDPHRASVPRRHELLVLLGGLVLSMIFARGVLKLLVALACLWLTVLCLVACCGLVEYIQGWLDRLGAL